MGNKKRKKKKNIRNLFHLLVWAHTGKGKVKMGKGEEGRKKGKMGGKDLSPFVLNIFDNSGKFPLYC